MKPMYLSTIINYNSHDEAEIAFTRHALAGTPVRLIKNNGGSAVIELVQDKPVQHDQQPVNAFADHPTWVAVKYRNYPK